MDMGHARERIILYATLANGVILIILFILVCLSVGYAASELKDASDTLGDFQTILPEIQQALKILHTLCKNYNIKCD